MKESGFLETQKCQFRFEQKGESGVTCACSRIGSATVVIGRDIDFKGWKRLVSSVSEDEESF